MKQNKLGSAPVQKYELVLQLFSLCSQLQAQGDRFYEEITFRQIFFLTCLQSFKEYKPTLHELSEAMGCSRQNTKVIAQKLEAGGLINSSVDPADKRKQRISLTDKAFELEKRYEAKDRHLMDLLFEGVDPAEMKAFQDVIGKMSRNLSVVSEWCQKKEK
ncbi:MAG: MarR family transcriptional regulator [Erysipelotrichaceae bacterium]|nr:MarR family transcriptional regulator [Erysipelotrichaceae bacterium]